jgi:hypothetical protein
VVLWHWVQQHRWLSIIVLAFVIVSCAGGTAWALVFRTVSSPVGLREALRMYRREQTEKMLSTLRTRLPAPGVYTYRTRGGEGLSLMGVQRSFPDSTSMIVTGDRCAAVSWVPITQHTETTTMCTGPAGSLTESSVVSNESIAGTSTTSKLTCPSTAYVIPPDVRTGQRWRATCSMDNPAERVSLHGRALGRATVSVGGTSVSAEHTRVTFVYGHGALRGTSPTDFWIVPDSGLIVREHESVGVTQGGVHYSEDMDTTLRGGLSPDR